MPDPKKKMTKKVAPKLPQSGRDIPLPQTTMGSVRRPDDIGPNRMPKPKPTAGIEREKGYKLMKTVAPLIFEPIGIKKRKY